MLMVVLGGTRSTWMVTGAHQAHRQIGVVGQAEGIELDADLLGQVIADRVAIGKTGDIGNTAGATDRF